MKVNACERLSAAMASLLARIHNYEWTCTADVPSIGLCVANPRSAYVPPPDLTTRVQLEQHAKEYFISKGVAGFYFQYWTPPALPYLKERNRSSDATIDDYQLTYKLPEFDAVWEQTMLARSLVYCPQDHEIGQRNSWFEDQLEAIRLTPLFDRGIKDCIAVGNIRLARMAPAIDYVNSFGKVH